MPFKSQAQSRAAFSGALGPAMKKKAKEFAGVTDYSTLPDHVRKTKHYKGVMKTLKGK